jgi:hypothetical protein
MKIRSSALKITVSAFAVLACTLLLIAGVRTIRNSVHPSSAKTAAVAAPSFSSTATSNSERMKVLDSYGKLPLSFIENQGQTAQEVRYTSHGGQYDLFLTKNEAVLALRHTKHYDLSPRHRAMTLRQIRADHKAAKAAATTTTALRMQFQNANPNPQISAADKLSGKVNYYIGNDPSKWHVGVPTYARVKYSQLYPGVDLVFYGNQRKLEYDFVVAPGVDPSAIRMNLAGTRRLHLNKSGDLIVNVADGNIELQKPVIYQTINGRRQPVSGKYSTNGSHVAFAVGNYDRREPLIIDPVLLYGTYLGGASDEEGLSIVVDAAGDAFVGGQTFSADFPLAGIGATVGFSNPNSIGFGFISELDPTGSMLLQSSYLGGTTPGDDAVMGVAIDPSGNVYVTGVTFAVDFPTTPNALKPALGANDGGTSFLAESNISGTLFYSSYIGGNKAGLGDVGNAVVADANGNAYITGATFSDPGTLDINFPVSTGALQKTDPSGANLGSAFLTVINTKASGAASLGYSSYLGGDGANSGTVNVGFADMGFGIALDSNNHAYIGGTTASTNFPVSSTNIQSASANNNYTAFISEIDTTKTGAASLVYSTYLGGSGDGTVFGDFGLAIDVQSGTTVAYITGATNSADFPVTSGAVQATGDKVNGAGYVTLVDTSNGSSPKYSTFLGTASTTGFSIKADKTSGKAVVGGVTGSANFPVTSLTFQPVLAANAIGDGFVSEIDPAVSGMPGLVYSTYIGGSGTSQTPDQVFGLALGTLPTVFVTGQTLSTNFPTSAGAFQAALDGPSDAFVASLNLTPLAPLAISPTSLSFTSTAIGTAAGAQTVTLTNNSGTAIPFTSATIVVGAPPASVTDFTAAVTPACASIPANGGTCTVSVNYKPSVATTETATLVLTDGGPGSPQSVPLTGNVVVLAPLTVAPTSLSFTSTAIGTAAGAQTVTLTNSNGTAILFTSATIVAGAPPASVTDFKATTTCTTVPANGTCTVSVNYTPSVATTETATLVLTNGGPGSPQSVALTGNVTATPPDFTISAAPASFSVARGATGTSTITITAVGDFDSAVTLTCSGAPAKSTCTIAPGSVTPVSSDIARKGAVRHADGDQATATLSFATTRNGEVVPPASLRFPPYVPRVVVPVFLTLFAMLFFFVSDQRLRGRLATAAVVLFLVVLAGCGGSSGGTPKGTVTLTVTGTAGGITHTTTVSATVTN